MVGHWLSTSARSRSPCWAIRSGTTPLPARRLLSTLYSTLNAPLVEGFVGWLIGTFVFYWWHRIRHANGFWQVFHQVHHSPSRIEVILSRLRRLGFPDAFRRRLAAISYLAGVPVLMVVAGVALKGR